MTEEEDARGMARGVLEMVEEVVEKEKGRRGRELSTWKR